MKLSAKDSSPSPIYQRCRGKGYKIDTDFGATNDWVLPKTELTANRDS